MMLMKEGKKIYAYAGATLLVVGILLTAYQMGWLDQLMSPFLGISTATPMGSMLGLQFSTSTESPMFYPLSMVMPGATYRWKGVLTNTGTATWQNAWVVVRLGINGATVTTKTESGTIGSFAVEQCSAGVDVSACREDIVNTWNLQVSTDGTTWQGCSNPGDKVCSIESPVISIPVAPGQSRTVYFKLTVPSTASGNYPLITQLMVFADGTRAVKSATDTLSIGTVSGEWVLTFVGFLAAIAGLAMLGFAFA